ncbi:MAG: hypothetical protein ACLR07_12160 [Christensenellales bacterium]
MKAHQARAYICHEREKFTFYALDWLALLLLLITPNFGPALLMMIECMQLGWLLAKKAPARVCVAKAVLLRPAAWVGDLPRTQPRLRGGMTFHFTKRETSL